MGLNLFDFVNEDFEGKPVRAPFMMPGGKSHSLKHLIPIFDEIRPDLRSKITFIDHFGGSGIVSFNYLCGRNIYNDRYSAVVDFYRCLREDSNKLRETLEGFHRNSRAEWHHCRDTWVTEEDKFVRSAKWYYFTANSFNGKRDAFAVDRTNNRWYLTQGLQKWAELKPVIDRIMLENLDVFKCIDTYDSPTVVHYFDPPYIGTDQAGYAHSWNEHDMQRLLDRTSTLEGRAVLSHRPSDQITEAIEWTGYEQWEINTSQSREGNKTTYESAWIK